jgi:uncharacterized protein
MTEATPAATSIYVDADACPVKDEVAKVALRHGLQVYFVSNAFMRLPEAPTFHRIVVPEGPDVADAWIAERAGPHDIVITADIPLAARAVANGARVLQPNGKVHTGNTIGNTLATRNLMAHLREIGAAQTYNAAFSRADRSNFLQALDATIHKIKRGQ